jgi:hypothetical protein
MAQRKVSILNDGLQPTILESGLNKYFVRQLVINLVDTAYCRRVIAIVLSLPVPECCTLT